MADPDRNAGEPGRQCGKARLKIRMSVYGGIRPFLNQNPSDVFDVGDRTRPTDARYIKHPAAARDDLRVVIARFFPVGNKIKLNMPPVCVAVYIHNHRLRAAAVHSAYDVKHPFWSHASVIHVLRPLRLHSSIFFYDICS